MSNRKGTEKPIEIFVALFIILAVALIMLKQFSSDQQEQKSGEYLDNIELSCQEKCTQAGNNGCSLQSLASLCMYGSQQILTEEQWVDLDNDKTKSYDTSLLAGIGVCEDTLYCFHVMNSCCQHEISPESCSNILKEYWSGRGLISPDPTLGDAELRTKLNELVPGGDCSTDAMKWDVLESAWN